MSTNVATLDTNSGNFHELAMASGIDPDASAGGSRSTLSRLKLQQTPIMGEEVIKGKKRNVEIIAGGTYFLEAADRSWSAYSENATIRPYLTRVSYSRYIQPKGDGGKGSTMRSVMSTDLRGDLKDTAGGFNCGRPSGYIDDWNALPEATKTLLRSVKRCRTVFGTITMQDCTDGAGQPIDSVIDHPFVFDMVNKDAFKVFQNAFSNVVEKGHLPVEYTAALSVVPITLNNGNTVFYSSCQFDEVPTQVITPEVQETFTAFLEWVNTHNKWILSEWAKNAVDTSDDDAVEVVGRDALDELIDDDIPF